MREGRYPSPRLWRAEFRPFRAGEIYLGGVPRALPWAEESLRLWRGKLVSPKGCNPSEHFDAKFAQNIDHGRHQHRHRIGIGSASVSVSVSVSKGSAMGFGQRGYTIHEAAAECV
jgi:hypothetical protein